MDVDEISTNQFNARKEVSPIAAFGPADINEQIIYSRAVEALNWGMPVVNHDLRFQAAKKICADFNEIVYWSGLPD